MADITMCSNTECKLSPTCYRIHAISNSIGQSYFAEPKKDCENKDYVFYVKKRSKTI